MTALSRAVIAEALGIDPALVTRYKRRGMPMHSVDAARLWKSANVVQRVGGRPSARSEPATPASPVGETESQKTETKPPSAATPAAESEPREPGYAEHRARRELAAAEREELELERARGNLIDRGAAATGFFEVFRVIRNRVLSVPRQLMAEIRAADTDRDGEELLLVELRKALGPEQQQVMDALAGGKGIE